MSERLPNADSDDAEQERRDRFDDNRPTREERMRDHFAQMDRADRTGPNH